MVYLLNTALEEHETSSYSLQEIYGIGKSRSVKLCGLVGLATDSPKSHINEYRGRKISKKVLENIKINIDLKRAEYSFLKEKMDLKVYKGIRYSKGLPVNGQRTRTNAQTSRLSLGLNKTKK